jgi:hypothetical protein
MNTQSDTTDPQPAPFVFCAECNLQFRAEDVISIGGVYCCSKCKPILLQKLREGCTDTASSLLSVTYSSTRAATWRCNVYTMSHNKRFAFVTGVCILFFSLCLPFPAMSSSAVVNGVFRLLAGTAAVVLLNSVALALTILKRLPAANANRTCTSALTSEGVSDITPERRRLMPWRKITEIREHNGDIHVWVGVGGIFIPREAFKDLDEAQRFAGLAVELRRSNGSLWPDVSVTPWRSA